MWTRRLGSIVAMTALLAVVGGTGPPAGASTGTRTQLEPAGRESGTNQAEEFVRGDLNGDGFADRITLVTTPDACGALVELGTPSGGYQPPILRSYLPPSPWQSSYPCPNLGVVLDLGGDGSPELVVTWDQPPTAAYHLVALRDFQPIFTVGAGYITDQVLNVTDLNGDGRQDIWITESMGLSTYLNTAESTLVSGPQEVCTVELKTALADFDHDGGSEIVVVTYDDCGTPETPSLVQVLFADGRKVTLDGQADYPDVTTLDANRDGHPDVRTTGWRTGVTTYFGRGDGTFVAGPVTGDDLAHAYRNTPKVIKVRDNDFASTTAKLTIVTPPKYGYLDNSDPRYEIRYVRTATHRLADTFVYRLTDNGKRDTATVTVKMKD